ncbi:hypothetical protein M378DRAFT_171104 [Amanita muscaria Koide BX008]|uniref:Uncharacterized protein n=1 Tax=Amanita muscaria (strain Koide BX008) TaxID=946122 RepID=A0A0C2WA19_AMAMK|nr:hypothetical protein M378DRAFT_171104 [Amanita muscaria Koide BX008]
MRERNIVADSLDLLHLDTMEAGSGEVVETLHMVEEAEDGIDVEHPKQAQGGTT